MTSTNSTGPIVDVDVAALQAVFSDTSAPKSAPQDRLEQPANIINSDRSEKMTSDVLTSCQKIQDTLHLGIDEISYKIGQGIEDLQKLVRHDQFKSLQVRVISAV